jgi:hypothetical protein
MLTKYKMMNAVIPNEASLAVPFISKIIGPNGTVTETNILSSLLNLVRRCRMPFRRNNELKRLLWTNVAVFDCTNHARNPSYLYCLFQLLDNLSF